MAKPKPRTPTAAPGDTKKKGKILYRMSSSGKWFKTSNSKKANQQRALNARLDAPISSFQTPQGVLQSPTTERQLAHEAAAAQQVKYGAQDAAYAGDLGAAQAQRQGNVHYYDIYKQKLQDWYAQVQEQQRQAVAGAQALPGLVQGLGTQQQGVVQQQQAANNAVTGGVADPTLATQAGQANQVAQSMGANWAGSAQQLAGARNAYAGNVANVVAPQQQAQALQQSDAQIGGIRDKIANLKGVEGAFNQDYRSGRRTDEQKTLLAEATLGMNSADKAADNKRANAQLGETKRSNKASEKISRERIRATRQNAKDSAARANNKRSTTGPFAGMTQAEINGLSDADATAKINAYDKKKGKGKNGKGPNWVTPEQQNNAGATAARARSLAHELRVGHPTPQKGKDPKDPKKLIDIYPPGVKPGVKYTRQQAANVLRKNPKMDEALLSATLDAAYVGHLSAYTVRKLIQAGYKPSSIASSLGVPTSGQTKKGSDKFVRKPKPAVTGSRQDSGR